MVTTGEPRPQAVDKALDPSQRPLRRMVRILQSLGAILVTLLALVLLFGVPARLLFGIFFH